MGEPFGRVLREFRLAAGLSQEALAERASLSPAAVSILERSARRAPQRRTIALLAEGLRLSPEDRSRLEGVAATFRRRGPRNGTRTPHRSPPNNIPCSLTSFHGRESALHELRDLLQSRRLVTLIGAGGVGKTRLAIETARHCLPEDLFDAGVFLVDFSTFTDPAFVASSIAGVFGIAERSAQLVLETLSTAIRTKSALLIFDNCEHVIDEAAQVTEYLLQRCGSIHILATNREALRLDGEVVVHLEPLVVEDCIETPAVQLFLDRVRDSDVKTLAVLSATERALVLNICARLDGLPLALELAAARAGDLSLASIADRIDERFALLDHGRRTAAQRQRTMRGAIDWSYNLLARGEQDLLRKLGIFAGSFRSEAAVAICEEGSGEVRDALAALIAKSLLAVVEDDAGHQRYRTLETIRAYALDLLAEHGEREALASRHARYYCELPKRLSAQYRFEFPRSVVSAVEPEIDNVHEALSWAFTRGDPAFAVELAAWSGIILWHVAAFAEAVRWCDRALALEAVVPPAVEARLWLSLAENLFNLGNMHRSLEASRNAVELYKRSRDPQHESVALNHFSHTLYQLGEIAEARTAAETSLSIARSLADDLLIGRALRMAAATSLPATAREYMREAFARYRAAEQQSGMEVLLMTFAESCFADGDVREALIYGREAVDVAAKNSHRARFAGALNNVAAYSLAVGDIAGARETIRRALTTVCDIGESINTMYALQHAGTIFCSDGAPEEGARLLGASDRLYAGFGIVREFTERTLYESTIAALREQLGERALRACLAEGGALTIEQAIELALNA